MNTTKAICPHCRKTLTLKTSGKFRLHGKDGTCEGRYCHGAYMSPKEVADAQPAEVTRPRLALTGTEADLVPFDAFDEKWKEANDERRARALRIAGYNGGVAAIRARSSTIALALRGENEDAALEVVARIELLMIDGKF